MRPTRTGILECVGGCYQCHGYEAHWSSKNSMAVAARHHDATGHTTWVNQTLGVTYGSRDAETAEKEGRGQRA